MHPGFKAESQQALGDGFKQLLSGPTQKALNEQRQLANLLAKLSQRGFINYPVTVKHSDRPDFQVLFGNRQISIEASKLTTVNLEYAASMQRSGLNAVLTSTELLRAGHQLMPRDEVVRKGFCIAQNSIPPTFLESDSLWCEQFKIVTSRKMAILSAGGYQCGDENWLLLWDKIGTPRWRIERRLTHLQEWAASIRKPNKHFDQILIQAEDFAWIARLSIDESEVCVSIF